MKAFRRLLAFGQGVYFLLTGLWPLFSRRSFEKVTGPKVDFWLVQTTGLLAAVIGSVLLVSGARGRVPLEATVAGSGAAASLAAIDIVYASRGRIRKIYLAEAGVEIALIAAWLLARADD